MIFNFQQSLYVFETLPGAMDVAGEALGNIPSDIGQLAKQTAQAVTRPLQTTTGIIDLASGSGF